MEASIHPKMLRWIPVLLAFTAAGCGVNRKLVAPDDGALRSQLAAAPARAVRSGHEAGAVYTTSNAVGGNAVLAFTRSEDGRLSGPRSFATGGIGTGAGLGNQSGLVLAEDGHWLFAVNAGSNDVSVFRIQHGDLELVNRAGSGGMTPISLTAQHDRLYVLNAGGAGSVQGFRIGGSGTLDAIPGSNRPLGGAAVGPAQIGLAPDGRTLVVTEKAANQIVTYQVRENGSLSGPVSHASSGVTPFGFGFARRGVLVVSEAFGGSPHASAVSSYRLGRDGALDVVSGSVPTTQTSACWIAISNDSRYAYATNAMSATVTGYSIGPDVALARLAASGVTATTGVGANEMAFSSGSRFLYVLNSGAHTIGAYRVQSNGGLEPLGETAGIPAGDNGLASR